MVVLDDAGRATLVNKGPSVFRRQDAPAVYDVTTIAFAARPDFIRQATTLYEGTVRAVVVPRERSLDIDTPYDLAVAECLLQKAPDPE